MEAETERGMGTPMNEADFEYLRNINTRPGPNAGRSINPSKPGPDDVYDKVKGHAVTQSGAEPVAGLVESADISEQVWQALCARADTSAGLIEAAEMAEECASECLEDRKAPLSAYALRDFAKLLRARAADRSGK